MNSSGIKRGLAVSAVSALAVAGIPALASSASAATGDVVQVGSVGATLNGGDLGGVVVLKTKNITAGDLANIELWNTALNDDPNTPAQSVALASTPVAGDLVASGDPGDSNPTDGFAELTLHVEVTTSAPGDTAHYAVVFNDGHGTETPATVDASDARVTVDQMTSGTATKLVVSPATQSAAQEIESGDYTVALQDSAGRATQLVSTEDVTLLTDTQITLTPNDGVGTEEQGTLSAEDLELGSGTFTATPEAGATLGNHTISLNGPMAGAPDATANLNVTSAATVANTNVDIVTGADSWDGFGDGSLPGTTDVRVDQGTIRIDIKGSTAGGTVTLNVQGDSSVTGGTTDVTFGGKKSTTVSTVLDGNGNGSLTITPDAGTIQVGDELDLSGTFAQTLVFSRAESDAIVPATDPFFTSAGGTVDVTVQVVDQFGDPITTGFVTAARTGANAAADATPQKKAVGADGNVTFTFTDTKAANGTSETVNLEYYVDQFATSSDESGTATIKYTADAMGANFNSTLDTKNTEAGDYDASDVVVVPLADTVDSLGAGTEPNESAEIGLTGGEPGATVKISVDNDALILAPGDTDLSDGEASVTATLDAATGNLDPDYRIVGTKSGVVTVTMTAANRTETAQLTVSPEVDKTTARNVTVSGPAEVESGTTQATFTAVVTDAFGNPVANVPVGDLNIQVAGPAQFQDSDAVTNADGQINLNVRLDSDAEGEVTVKIQGFGEQFGAAADRLSSSSTTDDGKGLTVSSNVATATTTVKAAPVEKVDPQLNVTGHGGKRDRVRANAISDAAGAKATLWVKGKKVRTGVLNANGNITFKVRDKNGNKKTKYVVKINATDLTTADRDAKRIR